MFFMKTFNFRKDAQMLTIEELKRLRKERNVSLRDIQIYANGEISFNYISEIETGVKPLTQEAHNKIVKGINRCYFAKKRGTYEEDKKSRQKPKEEVDGDAPVLPTEPVGKTKPKTKPISKKSDA